MKIGVLGGGLTGMTLGSLLNSDVEILEKNPETGGLCRSMECEGFTFDYGGSHIIFSKDREVMNFMLNSLGENKNKCKRNTKILFKGRYVKYPFENGLRDLSLKDNFECLYYYLNNIIDIANNKLDKPKNFKDWIYYNFGRGIAEKYMIPYNEKIWNTKVDLMCLDWINNRIPKPPLEDIIKSSLGIKTEGYKHQLFFYYPKKGGIQSLVRSIEKGIRGKVTVNYPITSIYNEDGKWIVSNGKDDRVFDNIISTIPIADMIAALRDVPGDIKNIVKNLKYNSLITVMVGLDTPKLNDISWLYLPESDMLANRVSFPSNFSEYVAPKGRTSVLAEITCTMCDQIWNMSDEEIADETIQGLHRLNILDKEKICACKVRRSRYAYVIYDLDYFSKMQVIYSYFNMLGVKLCGRFGEFKYLNMDACIRSAMDRSKELKEK